MHSSILERKEKKKEKKRNKESREELGLRRSQLPEREMVREGKGA
jgi:hypothetical protein